MYECETVVECKTVVRSGEGKSLGLGILTLCNRKNRSAPDNTHPCSTPPEPLFFVDLS